MSARHVGVALVLAILILGCAAHRASPPSTAVATASPGGSEILARRCGACHARPDPGRMSAEKWQAALERMKHKVTLPAAEWDTLAAMR